MGIIELFILFAVLGFIAWMILTYVPMPDPMKKVLIVVMVIVLALFLLRTLGIGDIPIGRG